jgi:minor histocompatibility antigen H13
MVTVATTLDVPIKLTFKAAAHKSILGLGDIVLPGMLMGWTLRFDLWLHYLRKIKYESTDLKIVAKDEASGQVITKSDTKHREVKMPYVDVTGRWGEWLWSGGLTSFGQRLPLELAATQFSKTYFYASLVGYLLGMLTTLAMLLVYKRGQPALLYLVPGVLGSILVTALVRGEMPELWKYTEDGSLDTEDVVVDLDGQGKAVKSLGQVENGVLDTTKSKDEKYKEEKEKTEKEDKKKEDEKAVADKQRRHQVLMVSIEALEDSD